MILMTAYSISLTVVGNVNHDKKIRTTNRFFDVTFALTGTKTGTFTIYNKRAFAVALRDIVQTFLLYKFLCLLLTFKAF